MIFQTYSLPSDKQSKIRLLQKELSTYKSYLKLYGVELSPPPPDFTDVFLNGSEMQQQVFVARFRLHNELFAAAIEAGKELPDDKIFIWSLFKKFQMRPPADLMDKIDSQDYIEIRDSAGVQIFGNFQFLTLLSYSVEEVFWYSWEYLFGRNQEITTKILDAFVKSTTTSSGPFRPEVPVHVCYESQSNEGRRYEVNMKMFSPVFGGNNRPDYMIATSSIRLLI